MALLIPLIPLMTARARSFAPAGGPLAIVSLQLFLGVTLKTIYTYSGYGNLSAAWYSRSEEAFALALLFMFLFASLISLGYIIASRAEEKFTDHLIFNQQLLNRKQTVLLLGICVFVFF